MTGTIFFQICWLVYVTIIWRISKYTKCHVDFCFGGVLVWPSYIFWQSFQTVFISLVLLHTNFLLYLFLFFQLNFNFPYVNSIHISQIVILSSGQVSTVEKPYTFPLWLNCILITATFSPSYKYLWSSSDVNFSISLSVHKLLCAPKFSSSKFNLAILSILFTWSSCTNTDSFCNCIWYGNYQLSQ